MNLTRAFSVCLLASMILTAPAAMAADKPAKFKCHTTWDEDYIYIGVEVDDNDVLGKHKLPNAEVTGDDTVSVYLQTPTATNAETPSSFRMSVSAGGGAQFAEWTAGQSAWQAKTVFTFKYGADVLRTGSKNTDPVTGYSVEIALPWGLLNTTVPKPDSQMRFNIVVSQHDTNKLGGLASLSSNVKSAQDVNDPSKWSSISFISQSFASGKPTREKVISSGYLNKRPMIDGAVAVQEWGTATAISVAASMIGAPPRELEPTPTSEAKPVKPAPTEAQPATIPLPETKPVEAAPAERSSLGPGKLSLAYYSYCYQANEAKGISVEGIANESGLSSMELLPKDGIGPWFNYDRVDLHTTELARMAEVGIDVVLPVYRWSSEFGSGYAAKGLDNIVSAIKQLEAESKPYPLVGVCLDMQSMAQAYGSRPDLTVVEVQSTLYGMIRDFFERVPVQYRAQAQLGVEDPRQGCIVFLKSSRYFSNFDGSFLVYCNNRFLNDFGQPLVWVADHDYQSAASGFDGFADFGAGLIPQIDTTGRLKIAAIGPGYDNSTLRDPDYVRIRSRAGGDAFVKDFQAALVAKPDWVVIDSWNDFAKATAVTDTTQYGSKYVEVTDAAIKRFRGSWDYDVKWVRSSVPARLTHGQFSMCRFVIKNTGTKPWSAVDGWELTYRWYVGGKLRGESGISRPIPIVVRSGESVELDFGIAPIDSKKNAVLSPSIGGAVIEFDLVRSSDNTAISSLGATPYRVMVDIDRAPEWGIDAVSCDIPPLMASGQTYPAKVVLRNSGSRPWIAASTRINAKLFKITRYKHGSSPEMDKEVPITPIIYQIKEDVGPGKFADCAFELKLTGSDGKQLEPWRQEYPWSYQLRFGVISQEGEAPAEPQISKTANAIVDIFEHDYSQWIALTNIPATVQAGEKIDARVAIRNNGKDVWKTGSCFVGYRWFTPDGLPIDSVEHKTLVGREVKPGMLEDVSVPLETPRFGGVYRLMWDISIDGKWLSSQPISRAHDMLVQTINVAGGGLDFVDMSSLFNVNASSYDTNRAAGDFDSHGNSFPAEILPPEDAVTRADFYPTGYLYPCGYNVTRKASALNAISFAMPPKSGGSATSVQCGGQSFSAPIGSHKMVYLLGASVDGDVKANLTHNYSDGKTEVPFAFPDWQAVEPKSDVAFAVLHTHLRGGYDYGKPCRLYVASVPVDPTRKLESVTLPKESRLRIVAVTFEK